MFDAHAMRTLVRMMLAFMSATLVVASLGFVALAKEKKSMLQGVTECKAWCVKRHGSAPSNAIQTCYRKCEAYWMCHGSNSTEETCKDGRALLERTTAPQLPAGMEDNTDRPGADLGHFEVTRPSECQAACRKDTRCRAWTYVRPRTHGPSGICYLKNGIPPASRNGCCISGVVPRGPAGVDPRFPPPASQN